MTRGTHTPEQIIRKLAEGNRLLGAGADIVDVCRHRQIAESIWQRWLALERPLALLPPGQGSLDERFNASQPPGREPGDPVHPEEYRWLMAGAFGVFTGRTRLRQTAFTKVPMSGRTPHLGICGVVSEYWGASTLDDSLGFHLQMVWLLGFLKSWVLGPFQAPRARSRPRIRGFEAGTSRG
jgi:hypothetical protein